MVLDLIPTITAENLDKWYPVMYPERSVADKIYDQILDDLNEENTIRYLVSKIRSFPGHQRRRLCFACQGVGNQRREINTRLCQSG